MLTLNDGRSELFQWDTGRKLTVGAEFSQVHFSNKVFGRSIDVDVIDGVAIIPDVLLQTDKDLSVWAFVGTAENGYTKISKTFKVNRRNKPADYAFTPPEQTTLAELVERIDKIEKSQDPDAIKNAVDDYLEQNPVEAPVQSVNGQTGTVELNAEDVGAIAEKELQTAINDALAQAKASGEFDGADGKSAYQYAVEGGYSGTEAEFAAKMAAEIPTVDSTLKISGQAADSAVVGEQLSSLSVKIAEIPSGKDGADGQDGITPTIGDNGNWYLGDTDTGKPSRGKTGPVGTDGKTAYQYAQDGGFTGTEEEFAAKMAREINQGAYPVVEMTADTAELAPNTYYRWGEVPELTITLGAEIEGITNEYCFEFVSGEMAATLTVPDTIKWVQTPSIEAGKTYQVSILHGIGVIVGA